MQKYLKLKSSREFLKKDFPENLLPARKLSKKDKRIIQKKLLVVRKIKKRLKKLDDFLQIRAKQGLPEVYSNVKFKKELLTKKIRFLFSSDQIIYDFLRNQSQNKTLSDFLLKKKEKKKISIIYGNISRKFFQKAYNQARKSRGRINENLLIQFETRLDVFLYRICFYKNIASARQSINHNLILVNGVVMNISSYQVKPGDVISVDRKKKKILANQLLSFLKKNLNRRHCRFFISMKHLDKRLKINQQRRYKCVGIPYSVKSIPPFDRERTNGTLADQVYSVGFHEVKNKRNQKHSSRNRVDVLKKKSIKKLKMKLSKLLRKKKYSVFSLRSKKNQKTKTYRSSPFNKTKRIWFLKCLIRLYLLSKLSVDKFYHLRLKKLMYRKSSRRALFSAMKISAMKPLNVEVSYKLLRAVVLFTPQKLVFPATINIELLSRSLAQN